jgi:bacterioferritin-associated ferredoxin
MIVCSCAVISDRDIEAALVSLMTRPTPLVPTPGVVYRELGKKMSCCGCMPVTVQTIYDKLAELEAAGRICAKASAVARSRLRLVKSGPRRFDLAPRPCATPIATRRAAAE